MKLLLPLSLFLTTLAFAGNEKGNGGVSVVCRDTNEKIESAQILDIFEGEVRYGKKYDNITDPETKIQLAQMYLTKYPEFLEAFRNELAKVRAIIMYVPVGIILKPTDDAFPIIEKKGCQYEQLANYTEEDDLLVSQEIYNELKNVDKAALMIHEVLYSLFREYGAKDSRQARKLTAELLAKNADQRVIDLIIEKTFKETSAPGTCGLNGSIDHRIKNCNTTEGNFALVTKTIEGFKIYKDLKSGVIWSEVLSKSMNQYEAVEACRTVQPEMANIPGLTWALPSYGIFNDANKNGIRKSLSNFKVNYFWSMNVASNDRAVGWVFTNIDILQYGFFYRNDEFSVVCVAR